MIDLSDNASLWGPPPAALRALRAAPAEWASRYPSPQADELRGALARLCGVDPTNMITGCGSDDVIDAVLRACAEPGDRVAFTEPTFSVIPAFVRRCRLEPVPLPFGPGFEPQADALLAADAKVIYLCSPNNPTGTGIARRTIERVLAGHRGVVILDEAYVEFAGESLTALGAERGNLVVTRTLSKAFGLAGLRVGFGITSAERVRVLEEARGPYKVNAVAEAVALAALGDGRAFVDLAVAAAVEARERLRAELVLRGFRPLPSQANFVLVPVARAEVLATRLASRGVKVRALPGLPGIGDAIRIGVAPWALLARLLTALDEEARACA